MSIFKPTFYINNIKVLLLDADNTLCIYHTNYPVDGVKEWIEIIKSSGIELYIVSNGKPGRLTEFANNVNLKCFYMSLKPLPLKINKVIKKLMFNKNEVALVGDQMFTDVLGGNLAGIKTIWLDYIQIESSKTFRFKRKIEDRVKKKLRRDD